MDCCPQISTRAMHVVSCSLNTLHPVLIADSKSIICRIPYIVLKGSACSEKSHLLYSGNSLSFALTDSKIAGASLIDI